MKRHEVHPARLSTSRNNGRWPTAWERFVALRTEARAVGEPPLWKGVVIIALPIVVAAIWIGVWS